MDTFVYFAYGSNMLTQRLQSRCPSAESIGLAHAHGYNVCFKKKSGNDKSGKATLVRGEPIDKIPGVLFQIQRSELERLDKYEGKDKGYYRVDDFPVISEDGGSILSMTYVSEKLVEGLFPYDWYLALVIAGAIQHKLPNEHIEYLKERIFEPDKDTYRKSRLEALSVLEKAECLQIYENLRKVDSR